MMRKATAASMQKTYDDCYLVCSTAVYFEGQGNETEALRSWRSALDQIYYHNAYRVPPNYVAKNETERALQDSLRRMEAQCKDRVDLLEVLRKSRRDAEKQARKDPATAHPTTTQIPVQHEQPFELPSKPPTLPRRPTAEPVAANPSSRTPSHAVLPSRTPSPEKRPGRVMLTTLRGPKDGKSSKSKASSSARTVPASSSKAAGLAWDALRSSKAEPGERRGSFPAVGKEPAALGGNALVQSVQRPPSPGKRVDPYTVSLEPPRPPPHRHGSRAFDKRTDDSSLSKTERKTSSAGVKPSISNQSLGKVSPAEYPSYRTEFPPTQPSTKATAEYNARINHRAKERPAENHVRREKPPTRKEVPRRATPSEKQEKKASRESSGDDGEVRYEDAKEDRISDTQKHLPKGVDELAAKQIFNEIVVKGDEVHWADVAGLEAAKSALKEAVVYPFLRPDLFMGLREPARGMLLFGPPGTGKTMLARAVATESKSTFFAISASSLTSKWLGESEKLVRALFLLAKALAPSIIFVDEIDSLLSARGGSSEHESTRRIKTEFLIQWSDLQRAAAGKEQTEGDASRVLVLAATNTPWAIDEAARRRFVRRQYIPLPEAHVRAEQLNTLLGHQKHSLSRKDIEVLVELTDGFSGSDITALAKDAAMGPLRSLGEALLYMSTDEIRPINFPDFEASLINIRPSVSKQGLQEFEDWAKEFGERGG